MRRASKQKYSSVEGGIDTELEVMQGALHTEIMAKHEGRRLLAQSLETTSKTVDCADFKTRG